MSDSSSNSQPSAFTPQPSQSPQPSDTPASAREHLRVTVYTPESGLKNPLQLIRDMWADTFCHRSRDFAWRMFVKNVSSLYRQSILGYLWILIPPVITSLVWVFLNRSKVLSVEITGDIPYPLYVLTGNLIWQGATMALATPIRTVNQERGTLTKINVPREAFLVAGFFEAFLNACIPMILLVPIMLYFKVIPGFSLILGLGVFISAILCAYAVGVLLTPVGLLYKDIGSAIPIATRFWFFVTPVAFGIPAVGLSKAVFVWNPATGFLETSRSLLLGSPLNRELLPYFAGYGILSIFVLLFSLILYRLSMPIIIERMSA